MKRLISFILTTTIMLSFSCVSYAQGNITEEYLMEVLYQDNITKHELYNPEMLEMSCIVDDNIENKVIFKDVIDPEKTFRVYRLDLDLFDEVGYRPESYDEAIAIIDEMYMTDHEIWDRYIGGFSYYAFYDDICGPKQWSIGFSGFGLDDNTIQHEHGVTVAVWNLGKVADILNKNGVKNVTDIYPIISGRMLMHTDKGKFVITPYDETVSVRSKEIVYQAWELVPADEMWDFRWKKFDESKKGSGPLIQGDTKDFIYERGTEFKKYENAQSAFLDIEAGTTLCSAIKWLADLNVVNGYPDGTYRANSYVTRAEVSAMLTRLMGYETAESAFVDTKEHWAEEYIGALSAKGIVNGYNGEFRPNDNISYEEFFKIILSILGRYDEGAEKNYPSVSNTTAIEVGLTEHIESFETASPATRGDIALILASALDTNIQTYSLGAIFGSGLVMFGAHSDITLFNYIKGEELHAEYFTSPQKLEEWKNYYINLSQQEN